MAMVWKGRRPGLADLLRSPLAFLALGLVVAKVCVQPDLFSLAFVALLAAGAALAAFRWPAPSLLTVIAVLPFIQVVQAWLWSHAVISAEAATRLGYLKELVLVVVVVRAWPMRPRPLPGLDRFALGLIALVGFYLVLPLGPPLDIRYVAARGDAAWIVVFLCARWLGASRGLRERLGPVLMATAALVAALAVWNRWGPQGWSGWVDGVGILDFRTIVLDAKTLGAVERVPFRDGMIIRAGSVFFTANDMAYYLLVVLGLIGGRMVQRGVRALDLAVAGVCTLAIFYSFSRSAMAMIGIVGLVLAVASGRLTRGAGAAVVCGLTFALLIGVLGAGDQIASGADSGDQRTASHLDALSAGVERTITRPLGSGLGTSSSTAIRFDVEDGLQTENFYLRLGVEMGLLGTLTSFTLVAWALRHLWRRTRQVPGPALGALASLAAVAVGAMVLETFSELSLSWTVWLVVGLALPAGRPVGSSADDVPGVLAR